MFQADESEKLWLAAGAFIFWLLVALVSFKQRFWYLAAVCTVAISLTVGHVIPSRIASNNTPQEVIAKYHHQLADKSVLLTNNVGLGTALAWVLKRSDITMLHQTGELGYGLKYPDAANRFYSLKQLPDLLKNYHYKDVAVVVESSQRELLDALPGNPIIIREGNLVLAFYEG